MKNVFCYNSNDGSAIIAQGVKTELILRNPVDWHRIDEFIEQNKDAFINVLLSYELKNSVEKLHSTNEDKIEFPEIALIVPISACKISAKNTQWIFGKKNQELVNWWRIKKETIFIEKTLKSSLPKSAYLKQVEKVKQYIQLGDVYEVNFCQQFYLEQCDLKDGFSLYQELNAKTKAPFSLYFNWKKWEMLGASPERFLKKSGIKLVSQPIKGTRPRGNEENDKLLKLELQSDEKERAENIMIVDLVRNDLAKIAVPGSVKVDELCEIYTFETVHQMISTISCEMKEKTTFSEIIQATFPMGSMTGAPKVRAMEIIDELENFRRGLYSGSVGYILPNGDFDLNVVIRSIIANKEKSVVSCAVGGAITILSKPENELEECNVKIGRILSSVCGDE